ncbi:hypothetical protein CMUS01_00238 [Colletotrichum musicola]|uniref:Uncharacterized protein n=1 Tax=Colletotrichum musicola TaxID=2175873 RepID=A0A8H6U994_9PEZI|nr:hypothetical protein CMUS01_00238 [Colletotrichum musicola]
MTGGTRYSVRARVMLSALDDDDNDDSTSSPREFHEPVSRKGQGARVRCGGRSEGTAEGRISTAQGWYSDVFVSS